MSRRAWRVLDGKWFVAETRVDGVANPDRQRNARIGSTRTGRQSLKFVYGWGATTRRGSDINTVSMTWQIVAF